MLKRFILALLALLAVSIAAPAAATTCNSVTVPTNIASQPGWTCGTTAPQFDTTNSAPNDWLDPAIVPNTQTGLANIPAPSYGPDRITSLPTCEYRNCSSGVVGATCTSFGLVKGLGGDSTCQETKFRTHVDFSHYGPDDPIRNFGAPGSSHLHCFFGNGATNANSTYGSLRRRALTSTAMGTDINGTAYWYPCIYVSNYDGAGHTAIVKADYIVVYYAGDGATLTAAQNAEKSTLLVPGLSYVFGFNMDDGGIPSTSIDHGMGAWLQNGSTGILDVANAANSAAGYSGSRYSVMNPGDTKHPNAVDYICMGATADSSVVGSGASAARFLALPAGGDPFNGTCESATFSGSVNSSNQLVVSSLTGVIQNGQGIAYLGGDWQNVKVGSQISGTTGGAGTYTLVCNGFPGNVCPPQTLPANTVATHAFFVAIDRKSVV